MKRSYQPASLDSFVDSMSGVCLQGFLLQVLLGAAEGTLPLVTIISSIESPPRLIWSHVRKEDL